MLLGTKKEKQKGNSVIVFFLSKYDFKWLQSYNFVFWQEEFYLFLST